MVKQLLPRADGDIKPILRGGDWAGPHIVVSTIRVIGHVEIHKEALTRQRLRLEITACRISLRTSKRIDKG